MQEIEPYELLSLSKKQKQKYHVITDPTSIQDKNFIMYNISLKKDYQNEFDYVNLRRGLTYAEEIINDHHNNFVVAKKGLRKFKDLLPEYLDIRKSHFTTSQYHNSEKNKIIGPILSSKANNIHVYNLEKVNGENVQISTIYQCYWIIGSKNKTLMLRNQKDIDAIKYHHQHFLTIKIAKLWFKKLGEMPQQLVNKLQQSLSSCTLIGQFCDSINHQHLVDYGQNQQLYFYALVDKNDKLNSCKPTQQLLQFCQSFKLPIVKYNKKILNDPKQAIVYLTELMHNISSQSMSEGGQGSVIYISQVTKQQQKIIGVCKIKTLQYRIWRKLRQKLKIYVQKYRKDYHKMHKKYMNEVNQLINELKICRPIQQYSNIALKAFELCQDQSKIVAKFINNHFITLLSLSQNPNLTHQKFMEMLVSQNYKLENVPMQLNQNYINKDIMQQKEPMGLKQVLVFVPLTIPSTGKSSLFQRIAKTYDDIDFKLLSSDVVRNQIMMGKMKKYKNMSKKEAFQKSRKQGNDQYYKQMNQIFTQISKSQFINSIFFLDKNHPQNALQKTIQSIKINANLNKNLSVKIICVLPKCTHKLSQKGKYNYPYSAAYILTCLKRVLLRQEHQTLQGSALERANVVVNFANMFRNFSLSHYNLSKNFDGVYEVYFHNEDQQKDPIPAHLTQLLLKILMGSKPNRFDQHPQLESLIKATTEWQNTEVDLAMTTEMTYKQIKGMFENFDQIKVHFDENQ